MNPVRPNASSSATPPTTGGSTSGRVTSARSSRCPGKLLRASTHASGTPMTREIAVVADAVHSERIERLGRIGPAEGRAEMPPGGADQQPGQGQHQEPDRDQRRHQQGRRH